jgi:predicted NBD/HSP70 family sugar kinase
MGSLWTEVQLLKADRSLAPDAHAARSTIARMIADCGVASRRDIVNSTGLARSTIDSHLEVLMDAGLVDDAGMGGKHTRGRPAMTFRISARRGVVLIAVVGVDQTLLAIATLDKTVVDRSTLTMPVSVGPQELLSTIATEFVALMERNGRSRSDALAISVGLPGPVDSHLGHAVRPPLMPGWDGFGVCRAMAKQFYCDVVVDNDVNTMALGEARLNGDKLPLLLISIDKGVGAGFVSESGLLLHGADGAAADIGHIQTRSTSDVLCRCGNRGCLEATASVDAIATKVSAAVGSTVDAAEVIERLEDGDPTTVNIVREVANVIGQVVADLVNFCNPALIVLEGRLTQCTEDVLAQVRSVVYQQSQPLATRNLSIAHGRLGSESGLVGGMVNAIEQVLSPRGIQFHTRAAGSDLLPLGL